MTYEISLTAFVSLGSISRCACTYMYMYMQVDHTHALARVNNTLADRILIDAHLTYKSEETCLHVSEHSS